MSTVWSFSRPICFFYDRQATNVVIPGVAENEKLINADPTSSADVIWVKLKEKHNILFSNDTYDNDNMWQKVPSKANGNAPAGA
jgi:hypothetical protein